MSAQLVLEKLAGLEPTYACALAAALQWERIRAENCLTTLRRRGFVEQTGHGWRLTEIGRQFLADGKRLATRRRNGVRRTVTNGMPGRVWWMARKMNKFSLADMLSTLATEDQKGGGIRSYVRMLQYAGYLQPLTGGNKPTRWLLVRDTGRMAPVWRRAAGEMYDPNLREVVWRRAPV